MPSQDVTTQESFVSIGTHRLFASVSGPIRLPGSPLLIIFPGSNAACDSWLPVSHLLSDTLRVLLYDRSGVGKSEIGPKRDTGANAAAELSSLLKTLQLPGPYMLLAHSYGGCVAREFLHPRKREVVGMVLSETGTETACQYAEEQCRKCVLGDAPLSVIRGADAFTMNVGRQPKGRGDDEQQDKTRNAMLEAMSKADEELKREQLQLSRRSKFRNVEGCGHSVHLSHPEIVAEEVRWVLSNLVAAKHREKS